jgi:dihydrofolate synthase/folylpolyglutamate synthase
MPDAAPSLDPMHLGLARVLPRVQIDPNQVIVVAGTNGKGSVCATLEALLLDAGETVGLYTSPHLEETTERIRISGCDISRELFCQAHQKVVERTHDLRLSHFEVLTLMAAWVFFSGEGTAPVKKAIFEVGLGGTWDATNAIPHLNCVITSLGYDHQNLLGSSLAEIATNKFGIITDKARVVHSPFPEEVEPLAETLQKTTKTSWTKSAPFTLQIRKEQGTPSFILETQWGQTPISLPGFRGAQNSATALTLFEKLGFDPRSHLSALSKVRWPGRMEKLEDASLPCPVYFSGDHNPQGIQSLLELLPHYSRRHLFILVGIGKDKNLDGILNPLFSLENRTIFLTETPFRGRSLAEHRPWNDQAAEALRNPMDAFRKISKQATSEDMILVTGSLYLVGYLKHELHVIKSI